MSVVNPPGSDSETGPPLPAVEEKDTTITDLILGVVNWWCLKFGNSEVIDLVLRHYDMVRCISPASTWHRPVDYLGQVIIRILLQGLPWNHVLVIL